MNNADAFTFGRPDINCFVEAIEAPCQGVAPVSGICSSVSVGDRGKSVVVLFGRSREVGAALGRVVRHGSESSGGLLFPLE